MTRQAVTVAEMLDLRAQSAPDRPALIVDGQALSFARLAVCVARLASRLSERGLGPGDRVGISIAADTDHLIASLALLRLGCCQVTLPTFDPEPMRLSMAERIGIDALLVSSADFALPVAPTLVEDIAGIVAGAGNAPAVEMPAPDPDAAALILTSSGTSGRPKLIPLTQRQIVLRSRCTGLEPGARTIFRPAPIEFNPSKRQFLFALCIGNTSIVDRRHELARLPSVCRELGVGHLSLTIPQARSLAEATGKDGPPVLPEQTALMLVGAAAAPDFRSLIEKRLTRSLYVSYGATEYGMIAIAGPGSHAGLANDVGRPLPGVQLEIVDEDGRPMPQGQVGEIRVRGPGMATAYLDDPESSAAAFRDGWYYTGDVGRLSRGRLILDGRRDDMMLLNSVNIFPQEIELAIERYPGVIECAAFPVASPVHGDIPMAAVCVEDNVDLGALRRYCREQLGIRSPRRLLRLAALPRNEAGKVLRSELAALYEKGGAGE